MYLYLLQENFDFKKQNITFKLYGKKYSHEFQDLEYKIFSTNKLKQNVLIGSSTSMTFRPKLLKLNYFNSSKGNLRISEISYFLNSLNYEPESIIIFFDPYHFNKNFPEISKNKFFFINQLKEKFYYSNLKLYYQIQKNILIFNKFYEVLSDIRKNFKKILFLDKTPQKIGFNGKIFNAGFRIDGSYKYPDEKMVNTFGNNNIKYNLDKFPKKNLYFGKNDDFINNFEKKLFFLVSKNQEQKKKILIILNTVESNFFKMINVDPDYKHFLQKYRAICDYFIKNNIKCLDKVDFAYQNKIKANLFYDPFHFRFELSNNLLKDVLKDKNINDR